jgi:beta-lactamase regulating signal transducer with metallopeptidase domain
MMPHLLIERTLNTLAEGLAVSGCVWLGLRWVNPLNSGTRFAVWFSTLAAVVALPLVSPSGAAAVAVSRARVELPGSWASHLLVAWATVGSLLLGRLVLSLRHIGKLRRDSSAVDLAMLPPELRSIWSESSRRVELRASETMRVPAAIGFLRPAVIVPRWTLNELPQEELKAILLHELAHLRRWDDWTNLAQKVVKAVFFFHPAVWWIESKLTLEREMACDDLVLAQTASPRAYAKSLLSLAERVGLGKGIALAQAALGKAQQTSQRIMQILDAGRPKATGVWKPAVAVVTAVAAVAIMAVPYTPNLVAFERHDSPVTAAAIATQQSTVIPAALSAKSAPIRANRGKEVKKLSAAPVIAARLSPIQRDPKAIQASVTEPSAPDMVLVMRAVRYDESGISVWTLTVWQITDSKATQKQLHPERVAKSL